MKKRIAVVLMVAVLCTVMCGCGAKQKAGSFTGNAKFFIKINPSFEMETEDGIVTALTPANEDAESIIDGIEYEGLPVSEVVRNISEEAAENGFLDSDGQVVYGYLDGNLDDENLEKASESCVEGVEEANEELHMEVKAVEGCSVCWGSGVCEKCADSGKPGYMECTLCHGSGKGDCTKCGGKGHDDGCVCSGGKCYRCEGTGKFGEGNCDVCGGSGKCKECGGTGQRSCDNCNATGKLPCEGCGGTGFEICTQCKGSLVCKACHGDGLKH